MSKRADNIGRFISSTRNLALVQMFVGVAFLGAASAGTYYVHQEIRAERIASETGGETKPAEEAKLEAPPDVIPAGDTVPKAEYDKLLRQANEYYDAIQARDDIITRQNDQINSGNQALAQNAADIEKLKEDAQRCGGEEQVNECPAPVNLQPYKDQIAKLQSDLAACSKSEACPPPRPPCEYQGMPCLDAIAAMEKALIDSDKRSKTQEERIASLNNVAEKLTFENETLKKQVSAGEDRSCEINGVPCEQLISKQQEQIKGLQGRLSESECAIRGVSCKDIISQLTAQLAEAKLEPDLGELNIDLENLIKRGER